MIVALKNLIVNGKKVAKGEEVIGVSEQELKILLLNGTVAKQSKKQAVKKSK